MFKAVTVFIGIFLVSNGHANAAPTFNYTFQDRNVSASDTLTKETQVVNSGNFGHFVANALVTSSGAGAGQDSTLAPNSIDVQGGADIGNSSLGNGTADSHIDVRFTISESMNFIYSGSFEGDSPFGVSYVDFSTTDGSSTPIHFSSPAGNIFPQEIFLFKGSYELVLDANPQRAGGGASYKFHLAPVSLPIVPLPPGVWAGLATLGGLAGLRYRRG
jgi:hypothetical protein